MLKEAKQVDGESAFVTIPSGEVIEFKPFSKDEDGHNAFLEAEFKGKRYRLDSIPATPIVYIYELKGETYDYVNEFFTSFFVSYRNQEIAVKKSNTNIF